MASRYQDVNIHDGYRLRKIGVYDAKKKIFKKYVNTSKHLFRVLDAWGMDSEILSKLVTKGAKIHIVDEDGTLFQVSAEEFHDKGQYYHFKGEREDHRTQLFLPRKEWVIIKNYEKGNL